MGWQQYYFQLILISMALAMLVNYALCKIMNQLLHTKRSYLVLTIIITIIANIEFLRHISLVKIIYSISSNISPVSFLYLSIWFIKNHDLLRFNQTLSIITRTKEFKQITSTKSNAISLLIIFIIGLLLYLSTLGFIEANYYSYGYHSVYLVIIIATIIITLIDKNVILGYLWSLSLLAFHYKLLPSSNLWDYLLDPVIWLVSSFYLAKISTRICWHRFRRIQTLFRNGP